MSEVIKPISKNMLEKSKSFLARVERVNKTLVKTVLISDDSKMVEQLMILGTDAVALYPSLDKHETGRVVREHCEKTSLKFVGLNWKELARYLAITLSPEEIELSALKKFIPTSTKTGGTRPGITNKFVLGPGEDSKCSGLLASMFLVKGRLSSC